MKNNRGMALVVALLTSFILLALVASLFWVIASTSRQAEYAKNSAIALNLAEAGTADAIYRLNYCTGTNSTFDAYPFLGTYIPFDLTSSDTFLATSLPELPPQPAGVSYAPYGIKRNLNNGYYVVGLLNDAAGPDTLIAVGIYKGIRRTLTVPLRGNSSRFLDRQAPTQGISEAFNKHVIYADTVTTGTTVSGNIAYTSTCTSTTGTRTLIAPALFRVPTPGTPPDLPIYLGDQDIYQESAAGVPELNGGALPPGVTYNNVTDAFTFDISYGRTDRIYVKRSAEGSPPINGYAIIDGATIQNFMKADGTITVKGAPTFFGIDTALNPLNGIVAVTNGISITGNLIVEDAPLTLNNVTVNGDIISNGNITFSGTSSTIHASTATDTAAVLVKASGAVTITIGISPNITLGSTQNAAIMCYSTGGAVNVNINADLIPTYYNGAQAAIIAYSTVGSATTNIGSSLNGLVYTGSGGDISQNAIINLNSGIVTGSLVVGGTYPDPSNRATGTVNLNGGTLNYDASIFTGVSSVSDIFSGFSSGRRVYVPVWQGWRLR